MKLFNNWICERNIPPNHRSLSSLYSFSCEITPDLGCVSTKEELNRFTHSHGFTQSVMLSQHIVGFIKHAITQEEDAKTVRSILELHTSQAKFKRSNPLFQHSHLDFSQFYHQNNSLPSLDLWAIKTGFSNGFQGI